MARENGFTGLADRQSDKTSVEAAAGSRPRYFRQTSSMVHKMAAELFLLRRPQDSSNIGVIKISGWAVGEDRGVRYHSLGNFSTKKVCREG